MSWRRQTFVCSVCCIEKSTYFYTNRTCANCYRKQREKEHPELLEKRFRQLLELRLDRIRKNPSILIKPTKEEVKKRAKARMRAWSLRTKYGLSLEDYNALLEKQGHSCGICQVPFSSLKRRPHVDHCHSTGKVRGILCPNCNVTLGHSKDNLDVLKGCISYLESSLK